MRKNLDSFQLAWDSIQVSAVKQVRNFLFVIDRQFTGRPWYHGCCDRRFVSCLLCWLLCLSQPPETGIGGVGNKKVISKFANKYQWRNWESGLSCRRQQVSAESQDRLIALAVVRTNHRTAIWNCTGICWPLVFLGCDSQICTFHLSWDILLVVWRKFHFCCGTAASSICVT